MADFEELRVSGGVGVESGGRGGGEGRRGGEAAASPAATFLFRADRLAEPRAPARVRTGARAGGGGERSGGGSPCHRVVAGLGTR